MNYLQYIDDGSKNVDSLRKARTFNELTGIVTSIKGAVSQIKSKLVRQLSKLGQQEVQINDSPIDFSSLSSLYSDIQHLRCYSLELEYAKSIAYNINGENKKQKFDKLVTEQCSECNTVLNLVYKYIDSVGSRQEPKALVQYYTVLQKYLGKLVKYSTVKSFVLPSPDKHTSFSRHIILFNVVTEKGFIIPNVIICISAETNYANGFFYTLSFPSEVEVKSVSYPFNTKEEMLSLVEDKLSSILGADLKPINSINDNLYKLDGVNSVRTTDSSLQVELDSGISASEVNNVLTKLLPMMYALTGVSNTRTDVLHRMILSSSGNRIIEFVLKGRTLNERSHLTNLKKILPLSKKSISSILNMLDS